MCGRRLELGRLNGADIKTTSRKFLHNYRLYPLVIGLLSLITVNAFVVLDEPTSLDSALKASRREFGAIVIGESLALLSGPARAASDQLVTNSPLSNIMIASQQSQSANLPAGLLESRLSGNVLEPPPFGMESSDIFYPS